MKGTIVMMTILINLGGVLVCGIKYFILHNFIWEDLLFIILPIVNSLLVMLYSRSEKNIELLRCSLSQKND